jgi:transcriptional regulator of arginine metabolism
MISKQQRQDRIRELIERNEIASQEQLLELLLAESIDTTQATVSRDLRDLGVHKGANGYILPRDDPKADDKPLRQALSRLLLDAQRAGLMVVLRTGPGQARQLAAEIDRARLREVLGQIAGDDTIFIAVRAAADARAMVRAFRHAARLDR